MGFNFILYIHNSHSRLTWLACIRAIIYPCHIYTYLYLTDLILIKQIHMAFGKSKPSFYIITIISKSKRLGKLRLQTLPWISPAANQEKWKRTLPNYCLKQLILTWIKSWRDLLRTKPNRLAMNSQIKHKTIIFSHNVRQQWENRKVQ